MIKNRPIVYKKIFAIGIFILLGAFILTIFTTSLRQKNDSEKILNLEQEINKNKSVVSKQIMPSLDTSNWNYYKSPNAIHYKKSKAYLPKFSIKYPEKWVAKTEEDGLGGQFYRIFFFENKEQTNGVYIEVYNSGFPSESHYSGDTVTPIKINGIEATRHQYEDYNRLNEISFIDKTFFEYDDSWQFEVWFSIDDKLKDSDKRLELKKTFETILSTFSKE